jgi:hypothetical protein
LTVGSVDSPTLRALTAALRRSSRAVFACGEEANYLVPDEALGAFMDHCNQRIGEAYFKTPRNTNKAFIQLLAVLEQNPGASWQDLLGHVEVANESGAEEDLAVGEGDDELATLRL